MQEGRALSSFFVSLRNIVLQGGGALSSLFASLYKIYGGRHFSFTFVGNSRHRSLISFRLLRGRSYKFCAQSGFKKGCTRDRRWMISEFFVCLKQFCSHFLSFEWNFWCCNISVIVFSSALWNRWPSATLVDAGILFSSSIFCVTNSWARRVGALNFWSSF